MTAEPAGKPRPKSLLRRLATPVVLVLAVLYFVIDSVFHVALRPFVRWLSRLALPKRLNAWIRTLGPYPTLALFLVPIILLEPVKPVGLYLIGTGHAIGGAAFLAIGEVLKIVVVERLFQMSREKLMRIPAFAWVYRFVVGWLDRLKALPPWQLVMAAHRRIRALLGRVRRAAKDLAARLRAGRRR